MKIDLSSFLDAGEAKKTDAGQELSGMVDYLAKFAEVVVRALKNGLDFENNINSEVSVVGLYHNTNQIIYTNRKKVVRGIFPIRALTRTDHIESFGWFIDDNGEVNVHARFLNAPTGPISCTLVILYV